MSGAFAVAALLWMMTLGYAMVESGVTLMRHCKLSTLDALLGKGSACAGEAAAFTTSHRTGHGVKNPFRHAAIRVGRTDEGVDITGTGPIYALGPGKVLARYVGWYKRTPWIGLSLDGGKPYYVAEYFRPTVKEGDVVSSDTIIGYFAGAIECGFADADGRLPAAHGHYHEGQVTQEGLAWRRYLGSLGVRVGKAAA